MAGTASKKAMTNAADPNDLDIANLSSEKIKQLMKSDPKFIGRLITHLDGQMHKLLSEKKKRLEQIEADEKAIAKIDETIRTHITPHTDRLSAEIKTKSELYDSVQKQVDIEQANLNDLLKNAASVIQKTRVDAGKLIRTTASQRLQEARGFDATMPTTQLLHTKTQKP